jgi:AraC-like DNA-binding protein
MLVVMPSYREQAAPPELRDLVACTWERRGPARRAVEARVLPDACADLVWSSSAGLVVAGPDTGPVVYSVTGEFEAVGLRMRPGMGGTLLGLPLGEIRDLRVPLTELWGSAAGELSDRLDAAPGPAERRELLVDAVQPRALEARPDPLVLSALPLLASPNGRVEAACRALGTSERHLRRRFVTAIGYGPKKLHRILRFRAFLTRLGVWDREYDGLGAAAAELGYADQAHLTRECRALAGLTPVELAARAAQP